MPIVRQISKNDIPDRNDEVGVSRSQPKNKSAGLLAPMVSLSSSPMRNVN